MAVTISLTGRLAIDNDGIRADEGRLGRLGRLALAVLTVERHRPVPQTELADSLWGSAAPPDWVEVLDEVAGRVRSVLAETGLDGEGAVRSQFGCYHLRLPPPVVVDVERAVADVERAERQVDASPAQALRAARSAAEIAGRPYLDGAASAWAQRQQADLSAVRVRALELVSEAASAVGEHDEARAAAEEAIGLAPLRESAHQRLIAALARAGDRPAALRAFERWRAALADELGTAPSPETEAAYRELLGEAIAVEGTVRTNLPDRTTTFVGREAERDEVRHQVAGHRLVTLTGPAGVGKSRLAHRIAADLVADYPDGVWLVDLAGLRDPGLVADRILSTLDLPERPGASATVSLLRALTARRALLVLDNCEHVATACAALADSILGTCLAMRLLAASRAPLGSDREVTWAVPALDIDAARRLFLDRARHTAPGPSHDDAGVVELCTLLDGIPLAIELVAAASATTPSLAALASDLRLRLSAAEGATLTTTLVWAYERLPARHRQLFDCVSVFAGGFTAEAAADVRDGTDRAVRQDLDDLVEVALVTADAGRFRIHETVRQLGAARLVARGDEEKIRNRHLAWAASLAEEAENGLEGADQTRWLARLDAEHDNVRVAHDWAAESGQAEPGLRLAAALVRYWEIRGYLQEGRARLDRWVAAPVDDALRAKALNGAAVLAQRQHDLDAARTAYEASLAIRRQLHDRVGTSVALHGLANLAVADDDFATARTLFEENLAIGRELGHARMVAASLLNLGVLAHYAVIRRRSPAQDAGREARAYYQQSLDAYRALGDRYGEALALENLGGLGPFLGDLEDSHARHEESMAIRRELGDKIGIATSARFLATRATWNGQFATARQLHEERLLIERELGNKLNVAEALASLAEIAEREGDHARARHLLEESIDLYQDAGDRRSVRALLAFVADVDRRRGELSRARRALDTADQFARDLDDASSLRWHAIPRARIARHDGDRRTALRLAHEALASASHEPEPAWLEASALEVLAGLAADHREFTRAARLLGAAAATRPPQSPGIAGPADPDVEHDREATEAALHQPLFSALLAEGRALAPAARRAYARGGVDE